MYGRPMLMKVQIFPWILLKKRLSAVNDQLRCIPLWEKATTCGLFGLCELADHMLMFYTPERFGGLSRKRRGSGGNELFVVNMDEVAQVVYHKDGSYRLEHHHYMGYVHNLEGALPQALHTYRKASGSSSLARTMMERYSRSVEEQGRHRERLLSVLRKLYSWCNKWNFGCCALS